MLTYNDATEMTVFKNTASLRTAPLNLPNAEASIVPHVHEAVVSDAKLIFMVAKGQSPRQGVENH